MTPTTQRRATTSSRVLSRANFDRLVLTLVIAGSAAAVWWSTTKLRTLRQRSSVLSQQVAKLQGEIGIMRNEWPESRALEISRRFADVPATLFPGSQAVSEWIEEVQRAAVPLALDVEVNLRGTRTITNESGTVTLVRAHLNFPPSADVDSPTTPYLRILQFVHQLAASRRRLDLLETSFAASSNSLDSASAVVELWANEAPAGATNAVAAPITPQHAAIP